MESGATLRSGTICVFDHPRPVEADLAQELSLKVNEKNWPVTASSDTPLLYVLTNELQLNAPRFGCGLAQCGSCSVLADGVEIRSCVTPLSQVVGKAITTLEGLPQWYAKQKGLVET